MKIVLINGGRGATSFINYLSKNKKYSISSIVNAYDDGKSTGTIRDFFNILGPSDIRKVQSLFLDKKNKDYKINKNFFEFRFDSKITNLEAKNEINKMLNIQKNIIIEPKFLKQKKFHKILKYLKIFNNELFKIEAKRKKLFNFSDCSIINCIYAGALIFFKNNIEKSIFEISSIFNISSEVLVNSTSRRYLYGIRSNGEILESEKDIVEIRSNEKIEDIFLLSKKISINKLKKLSTSKKNQILSNLHSSPQMSNLTKKRINSADYIVFCPGTQHSSLFPTYLTKNFCKSLKSSNAKKIYISNIGADYETPNYRASDYINGALKYIKKNNNNNTILIKDLFDYIFVNKPKNKNKNYVKIDLIKLKRIKTKIIINNFESKEKNGVHDALKIFKYLNI